MITLALEKLYGDVRTRFAVEQPTVDVAFGWKEPPRQRARACVVFTPGDPSGTTGEIGGGKYPGRNPRPLATLYELFTVTIRDNDPAHLTDELAQYKAARLIFDAWYRAVYLSAYGTFKVLSSKWLTAVGAEHRRGAGLEIVCAIEAMIPDAIIETAPVDTIAGIVPSLYQTPTDPTPSDDPEMTMP